MTLFRRKPKLKHFWEGYRSLAVIVYNPTETPDKWETSDVFPLFYLGNTQVKEKLKKLRDENPGCDVRRVSWESGFYWDRPDTPDLAGD